MPSRRSLTEPLISQRASPEIKLTGFFANLTFSWINPLLRQGFSKPLEFDDIPSLAGEDEAGLAFKKFSDARNREGKSSSGHIDHKINATLHAILSVHKGENAVIGLYALLRTIAVVTTPLILYSFVSYAESEDRTVGTGAGILTWLVLSKALESLSQRQWFFGARRSGMRIRSALIVAVYDKQLRLSISGRRRHSSGEVAGYVSVDAYRMGEFPWWLHTAWSSVAQLVLAAVVLVWVAGWGAIPGLAPVAICAAFNVPFARAMQRCQLALSGAQDRRLAATAEALGSMKAVKLQSWEESFRVSVESKREEEFLWLSRAQLKKAVAVYLYWMSPTMVSATVLAGSTFFGGARLDAAMIFTVLASMRTLAEPVRLIPEALSALIQVKVSFDRLNSFLLEDEVPRDNEMKSLLSISEKVVVVSEGVFSWNVPGVEGGCSSTPTLRRINLEIKSGQKVAVCGAVGSGKSSLLYALLGEIPKISGSVEVFGSVAYVSQTPWIQSGTIRENVLYGKAMIEEKYDEAIKSCDLDKDINGFDHGDLTEIGQRGINMSGGQRQRIQLARAVYNDADVYLLDDPFSAVDAHTAALLFNGCVMTALRDKTVILVTHQVEFLSGLDKILVMEFGEISQSGSYDELLKPGTAFEKLVSSHKDAVATGDYSGNAAKESEISFLKQKSAEEISAKSVASSQLTQIEERDTGDLEWKSFRDYIAVSKGLWLLSLCFLTQTLFVLFQAGATYWLAFAIQLPNVTNSVIVGVYAAISFLSTLAVYLRANFSAHLGLRASKAFFSAFTSAIFRAPMCFFDSTPIGRIITRASSDLSVLDIDIPFSLVFVIVACIDIVATITIMTTVTWQVLFVAVFSLVAAKYVQNYYLASARELVRINGTTKAPVTNFVSETAQGAVTIRAFRSEERFFQSYLKLVDTDASLFFLSNASIEWVVMRIEALQNLNLFTASFFLLLLPKGQVASGLIGLSLSYALSLSASQVFLTRWYCNLSNYIVSVERIKQFMDIPSEPPAIIESNRPPLSWPTKGRIELQSLNIKYRPNSPLVLKDITCTFVEGTRVGVVGRTGSGKTTLISALFRLVEPTSGKIIVDGLDISSIGLKDLRMKLSIIPQEPTLFRGSIRTNMDPLGLYSDHEIWKALEKCQLKETVNGLPNLLDSSVSDEGENWSAGQRQLFCLGRVLLKRNRILVLDEATASIDSATDAILQRIIREEFVNCTVITVAHRVPTVIDSHMVMVLSYGKLVEYDQPLKLIDSNSYFSKLVAEYWASCRRNE